MKTLKALFVITTLTVSSLAMAAGGGDRTFARADKAAKASMEAYRLAQQQKVEAPVAESKTPAKPTNHAKC